MIVTQICQGLVFDLLVSNYGVKFRSLFLVALASRLQNVPSSKLVKPLLPISLVPECKRSSSCSFTFTWGLKCWWPLWWGNVAYAYLGCCHTSDLPGWLRKVKAALQCLTLLCSTVSTFCLGDACVRPCRCLLPGITWWWNTRDASSSWERTWGRCHSVPHKHLLWVPTTGHCWLQDSWLDGRLVWSGSSSASNM